LRRFSAAGVDRAVFYLPPAPAEQVEPYVEHLAGLAAEVG